MSPSATTRQTRLPRAERERQILAAAHALFAERGYEAVTMDDVAARVGVTKPLLYAYTGNKEQLYLTGLERAGRALQAIVLEAVEGADGPDEAFRAGVGAFFAFVDSDRDAWRVLFAETLPAGGEIARRVEAFRLDLIGLVAGILLQRLPADRRERARNEVEALSHALLGAAEALARWWLGCGAYPPMPAAAAADLLVATVQPGLRERSRSTKEPLP